MPGLGMIEIYIIEPEKIALFTAFIACDKIILLDKRRGGVTKMIDTVKAFISDYWLYYLLAVNVLGALFYGINQYLYDHTENKQIDFLVTISALLGGSLGIIFAMAATKQKIKKENMMSTVFVICVFVIQALLFYYIFNGGLYEGINLNVIGFFNEHRLLLYYLGIINIVAFIVYGIDKLAAIKQKSRIPIITLLGLAFIGGSIGAWIAMYVFRHKTRKDYFVVGIPLIFVMQIVVLFFAMNAGVL